MLDIDADDELIGRQVMKLMNALYQSSDQWLIYSNFIWPINGKYTAGFSKEINPEILAANNYRVDN